MDDVSPLYENNDGSDIEVSLREPPNDINELSCENGLSTSESIDNNRAGIGWFKASFLIVNAALGAGLLNFPHAFDESGGIVSGNLMHVVFVICALSSLIILAVCAQEKNCKTYQEVVKYYCGPKWSVVASLCISVYCFITCITFIVIIGDQFDRAFASFYGYDFCFHWYMNRKFTMTVSSLLLVFPCCFKRIDGMEGMSYVGVLSIIYLSIVIVVELIVGDYDKGDVKILDIDISEFFNSIPTICFGYQCHVSSVPIFSCLKKGNKTSALKSSVLAILSCFILYTVTANSGYCTFGSLINSDILLDYDATKVYVLIAVILLAVKSWTTYPILMFCVREAVSDLYLVVSRKDCVEAAASEPKRRKVIAVVLWLLSILLAVFIPSLNVVIKLLGSLAGVFILIFPGLCFLNRSLSVSPTLPFPLEEDCSKYRRLVLACFLILLGVFSFSLAFALGVQVMLQPNSEHPICIVRSFTSLAVVFDNQTVIL